MCAVLLLLPVLAVLQYRWVGEVSQAERERMQSNLQKITTRFAEDFDHEVGRELASASISSQRGLEVNPDQLAGEYVQQYKKWHRTTQYPKLFRRGCLADISKSETSPELSCFNPNTGTFETTEWPADFAPARERLTSFAARRMMNRPLPAEESPILVTPLILPPTRSAAPRQFPHITHWTITELNQRPAEVVPIKKKRHGNKRPRLGSDL